MGKKKYAGACYKAANSCSLSLLVGRQKLVLHSCYSVRQVHVLVAVGAGGGCSVVALVGAMAGEKEYDWPLVNVNQVDRV